MGYFSNGTEGMIYEERYCCRCIHRDGPDGNSGCAIWLAHLTHNYKECNKKDSVLHLLIPQSEDGLSNEQCRLFLEAAEYRADKAAALPFLGKHERPQL